MNCERDIDYPLLPVAGNVSGETFIFSSSQPGNTAALEDSAATCLIQQAILGEPAGQELLCEGCGNCARCESRINVVAESEFLVELLRGR